MLAHSTPDLQCRLSEVVNRAVSPENSRTFHNPEKPETQISRPAVVSSYGYLVNFPTGAHGYVTAPALRWVWSDGASTGLTAGAPFVCWHPADAGQRNHDDCEHCRILAEMAEPEW